MIKNDVGIIIWSGNRLRWRWSCEQSRKTCQLWISGTYKHFQQTVFEFKKYIINKNYSYMLILSVFEYQLFITYIPGRSTKRLTSSNTIIIHILCRISLFLYNTWLQQNLCPKKRDKIMCFHIHKKCNCMHYLWIYWWKLSMNCLLPGLYLKPFCFDNCISHCVKQIQHLK